MDIFIIETACARNIPENLLQDFKHKEFSNPQKLVQHSLSYLMVDRILKGFYCIENCDIVFIDKKPVLRSGKKHFSISHSQDLIALAFSDSPCGIDIEKNGARDFSKLAQRLGFVNLNPSIEEFYAEWTAFEAKYKLNMAAKSSKTFQLNDYTLTAVSSNIDEKFELYFQSGEENVTI